MTSKAGILIPVHNKLEYTRRCLPMLTRLLDQNPLREQMAYEVVVIDDGSSDGTADWLRENHPGVHLLTGDGSWWWSGSINRGAHFASEQLKCQWVILWNNDIIPANGYFKHLTGLMLSAGPTLIIGSTIRDYQQPDKIWSMGGFYNPFNGKKYMLRDQAAQGINHTITAEWLTGMGTAIPCKIIQEVGYWNEKDFPQYYGDTDFTWRASRKGYQLKVDPRLLVYNDTNNTGFLHGSSFKRLLSSLTSLTSKYNIIIEWRFYRKHARSPLAFLFLAWKYFRYIGGYFKWKVLNAFGIKKNQP